jgi:hypothetical protein
MYVLEFSTDLQVRRRAQKISITPKPVSTIRPPATNRKKSKGNNSPSLLRHGDKRIYLSAVTILTLENVVMHLFWKMGWRLLGHKRRVQKYTQTTPNLPVQTAAMSWQWRASIQTPSFKNPSIWILHDNATNVAIQQLQVCSFSQCRALPLLTRLLVVVIYHHSAFRRYSTPWIPWKLSANQSNYRRIFPTLR